MLTINDSNDSELNLTHKERDQLIYEKKIIFSWFFKENKKLACQYVFYKTISENDLKHFLSRPSENVSGELFAGIVNSINSKNVDMSVVYVKLIDGSVERFFPPVLYKFGKHLHMESLLYSGNLHCNTLGHFIDLENTKKIGDKDEGLKKSWVSSESEEILISKIGDVDVNFPIETLKLRSNWERSINVCSFTYIDTSNNKKIKDISREFMSEGYDTYIKINNIQVFIDRIQTEVSKEKIKIQYGKMKYVPRDISIDNMWFTKFNDFSSQCEFRVAFYPTTNQVRDFIIGSIEDIASIGTIESIIAND